LIRIAPFRTLDDVLAFLSQRTDFERQSPGSAARAFDLERVGRLADAVGAPHRAYRCVHVAGTKGKGSTSRLLAALLKASGLRIGLYTSPHIEHFLERVCVDGSPILEAAFVRAVNILRTHLEPSHTFFEIVTVASFLALREAAVDWAVVEVGIGGRLDATNIVCPEVSVITGVDYDHMDLLGDTLEKIAREKAGIIKPGVPVVCGKMGAVPSRVVAKRAQEVSSPFFLYGRDYKVEAWCREGWSSRCVIRVGRQTWEDVVLSCPAAFMAENASNALAAYTVLRDKGLVRDPGPTALLEALARTALPACCEVFPGTPLIVIDGAHNVKSADGVVTTLREMLGRVRVVLVIGVPRDKEVAKMLRRFASLEPARVLFTPYQSPRSASPEDLAAVWQTLSQVPVDIAANPQEAFAQAMQIAGSDGAVVVSGSLYLAGTLRPLARRRSELWKSQGTDETGRENGLCGTNSRSF
jgi:dihydrofolate synthase/folylpolyglutamate synthase